VLNRSVSIAFIGLTLALSLPSATERGDDLFLSEYLISHSELEWIPFGFSDTREDGEAAAKKDIQRNNMMFAMYGAVEGLSYEKYLALSVTPILMGCGIGGKGWEFWTAYNRTIIHEMQSRGYNFGRWGLIQS